MLRMPNKLQRTSPKDTTQTADRQGDVEASLVKSEEVTMDRHFQLTIMIVKPKN
jgi:hypothetical protein